MTTLARPPAPIVIGHRGAPGYRPEHTLASYRLALALGVDAVEPDLVVTRDGVLVVRHENEISATTDVALHPELADRRTTKVVAGREVTGWFTEDLTLAELKTLRCVERLPDLRPGNRRYDGRWPVATFDELLLLVAEEGRRRGRPVGVHVELKTPSYFAGLGLPLEEAVLAALRDHGLDRPGSGAVVQSFETAALRSLRVHTALPLVQLIDSVGAPADCVATGDPTTHADLASARGLRMVAGYADLVGVHRDLVRPRDPATGRTADTTTLVDDAHLAGLRVLVWTLRAENRHLPAELRNGAAPGAHGDARAEARAFLEAGVDGVFSDHPDLALSAREDWLLDAALAV
ncbi:glycerophosphodiester phosphodiesterase family protein [Nocardioides sp. SYSU D00038]|uniref:glycerophosphodiester phosphodiesterase family protein n=1 Tax=Nocardioides sp. SYSU D00038 TaxID=2812554 RepID=UPI0027DE7D54|nr:glycerophosphodiester phosphodiesterase family protein [Nocardioides sp. SYSU D00038]